MLKMSIECNEYGLKKYNVVRIITRQGKKVKSRMFSAYTRKECEDYINRRLNKHEESVIRAKEKSKEYARNKRQELKIKNEYDNQFFYLTSNMDSIMDAYNEYKGCIEY